MRERRWRCCIACLFIYSCKITTFLCLSTFACTLEWKAGWWMGGKVLTLYRPRWCPSVCGKWQNDNNKFVIFLILTVKQLDLFLRIIQILPGQDVSDGAREVSTVRLGEKCRQTDTPRVSEPEDSVLVGSGTPRKIVVRRRRRRLCLSCGERNALLGSFEEADCFGSCPLRWYNKQMAFRCFGFAYFFWGNFLATLEDCSFLNFLRGSHKSSLNFSHQAEWFVVLLLKSNIIS